jgi:hypothetical protein
MTKKWIREAHCYSCGDDLNSEDNEECEDCEWLLCDCGRCGCEFEGSEYRG